MGMPLILVGLGMALAGAWLVRRFSARAHHSGIGSFRLLPWAGLAWLLGVLLIGCGLFFALLGWYS